MIRGVAIALVSLPSNRFNLEMIFLFVFFGISGAAFRWMRAGYYMVGGA
jgi:hypothetical protein